MSPPRPDVVGLSTPEGANDPERGADYGPGGVVIGVAWSAVGGVASVAAAVFALLTVLFARATVRESQGKSDRPARRSEVVYGSMRAHRYDELSNLKARGPRGTRPVMCASAGITRSGRCRPAPRAERARNGRHGAWGGGVLMGSAASSWKMTRRSLHPPASSRLSRQG